MSVQDLSIWHDRRTAGNAYRRGGHLSFQQLDRATDHAEASVSVAGAAAIPSARQLGSSTNSRSEPYNEPSQSSPLILIINQDIELLKVGREAMIKRKLDEKTIQNRMNGYTAHVAYHLWQMYLQNHESLEEQALDDSVRPPNNDQLRAEINRVGSTLIHLMEP
jgi:hypothetical protein